MGSKCARILPFCIELKRKSRQRGIQTLNKIIVSQDLHLKKNKTNFRIYMFREATFSHQSITNVYVLVLRVLISFYMLFRQCFTAQSFSRSTLRRILFIVYFFLCHSTIFCHLNTIFIMIKRKIILNIKITM